MKSDIKLIKLRYFIVNLDIFCFMEKNYSWISYGKFWLVKTKSQASWWISSITTSDQRSESSSIEPITRTEGQIDIWTKEQTKEQDKKYVRRWGRDKHWLITVNFWIIKLKMMLDGT